MARRPRDPGTGQLDLFLTETEPAPAKTPPPRLVLDPPSPPSPPPPPADPEPQTPTEPDMTSEQPPIPPTDPITDLPPPPDDPPEVAADIRAMFLEEEERQRAEETITIREGKPPLVTGIYRKPRTAAPKPLVLPLADPLRRPSPPPPSSSSASPARPQPAPSTPPPPRPAPPAPPRPSTPPRSPRPSPLAALRTYLSDAPLGPKGLLALLGAILLVALLAWWSGSPKKPAPQEPTLASTDIPSDIPPASPEVPPPADDGGATSTLPPPSLPAPPTPPATATATATATTPAGTPAIGLRIPGATVTLTGDGAWQVRYDAAVFVSADRISVEGMKALKATAAALLKLPDGATITIQGHTDDIPPPPDATGPFRTNADLAAARAAVVQEHLNVFCKRQSRYVFETAAPGTVPAPYPNDTDAHRRLNRTATLRIVPTGRAAD